ncbi:MAG: DUF559 domain-containing protein [Candidatus Cloacimonetes bacterium]|nr:DUF559 domain-containing protein [Candidatus Cloacimonadota bacterium]
MSRKFSNEQEIEIGKQYLEEEVSLCVLADRWNCNNETIRKIVKRLGETRTHKEAVNTESYFELQKKNNPCYTAGENHPTYNTHRSEKTKRKMSKAAKGKYVGEKNPMFGVHRFGKDAPNYGKHPSDAAKRKMSKSAEGKHSGEKNPNYGKHPSDAAKRKMREKAIQRLQNHPGPFKDTKPELKMKEILNELNIPFEHQFRLGNHLFDFRILNTNILIEVDGDYWHGNLKIFKKLSKRQLKQKQKDIKNEKLAKENNFILLRFWENDILKDSESVKVKICNVINL